MELWSSSAGAVGDEGDGDGKGDDCAGGGGAGPSIGVSTMDGVKCRYCALRGGRKVGGRNAEVAAAAQRPERLTSRVWRSILAVSRVVLPSGSGRVHR